MYMCMKDVIYVLHVLFSSMRVWEEGGGSYWFMWLEILYLSSALLGNFSIMWVGFCVTSINLDLVF